MVHGSMAIYIFLHKAMMGSESQNSPFIRRKSWFHMIDVEPPQNISIILNYIRIFHGKRNNAPFLLVKIPRNPRFVRYISSFMIEIVKKQLLRRFSWLDPTP